MILAAAVRRDAGPTAPDEGRVQVRPSPLIAFVGQRVDRSLSGGIDALAFGAPTGENIGAVSAIER